MRDGDHGRRAVHYYCDGPEHPLINYRHAHMHDGPKDDCDDDDPGDAPRRPRPRIADEAEQTFVRVPRYGSDGDERRRKDGGATLVDNHLLNGDRN